MVKADEPKIDDADKTPTENQIKVNVPELSKQDKQEKQDVTPPKEVTSEKVDAK